MAGVISQSQAWAIQDLRLQSDEDWVVLPVEMWPTSQVVALYHSNPYNRLPL